MYSELFKNKSFEKINKKYIRFINKYKFQTNINIKKIIRDYVNIYNDVLTYFLELPEEKVSNIQKKIFLEWFEESGVNKLNRIIQVKAVNSEMSKYVYSCIDLILSTTINHIREKNYSNIEESLYYYIEIIEDDLSAIGVVGLNNEKQRLSNKKNEKIESLLDFIANISDSDESVSWIKELGLDNKNIKTVAGFAFLVLIIKVVQLRNKFGIM